MTQPTPTDPMMVDQAGLRRIADTLGVPLDELVRLATNQDASTPTIREFRPRVEAAADAGARATYASYWNALEAAYGDTPLSRITTTDLRVLANRVKAEAVRRRFGGTGNSAVEHFVSAARCFFRIAEEDGLILRNPAAKLKKPRRSPPNRRPLTQDELEQLVSVLPVDSDDPQLDRLLVRFHLETGARRQGALNLTLGDIDPVRQTVWLTEKYNQRREQPVTGTLIRQLTALANSRGATHPHDPVFLYRSSTPSNLKPVGKKRYETLFRRVRPHLGYAATTRVDSHTLRTTAIAMVERVAGHEVARAFAGHAEPNVTSRYAKASIQEVARAVGYLWNENHPLAHPT